MKKIIILTILLMSTIWSYAQEPYTQNPVARRDAVPVLDSFYTAPNDTTAGDTTITITPNTNTHYIVVMIMDTNSTGADIGIAHTVSGEVALLGAIASADGVQSLTMTGADVAGREFLIYLPCTEGTITLYLKDGTYTAAKRTKIITIQQ